MDKRDLKYFAKQLQPNAEVIDNGDWVNTNCPLAKWTHERGADRNPSFGMHVGTPSMFHCLACKKKGPLTYLLDLLEKFSGEDYGFLRDEIAGDEMLSPRIHSGWVGDRDSPVVDDLGEPLDAEILNLYDSAAGHGYLRKRGVLDETAEELGLLVDPDNKGAERVLFPVYSTSGGFYGLTGRATDDSVSPKVRDYFGLDKRLLLLGSHMVSADDTGGRVVLVEGLFDFAILYQLGYPAMAAMHSNLANAQANILRDIGMPVVVFFDNDRAGKEGTEVVAEKLYGYVPVLSVSYPSGRKFADPGSLPDDEIEHMVESASLILPKRLTKNVR